MRIIRILAPNPGVYTLEGTNTWVVGADPSFVIDPGPDDEGHVAAVAAEAGNVGAILVTHRHEDHAAGAAKLSSMTGSPVFAHSPGAGDTDGEGWQPVHDDQEIVRGGVEVRAVHTPGHSPDHFVFHVARVGALFTGDAVLGRGTSVIDPPEGDLEDYMRSLRKMQGLNPRVIYPGHGPAAFDAMAKLSDYVAHREERDEEIFSAVSAGQASVEEIVETVYSGYPPDAIPLAGRTVLAHLLRLEAGGRIDHARSGGQDVYSVAVPRNCARCGRRIRGRTPLCGRCSLAVLQEGPGSGPGLGAGGG